MIRVTIVAFTLFYALCCLAPCLAFDFEDCGSALGKFKNVLVSGCSTSNEKCILMRGTNASMSFTFTPNKDISEVNVRAYGILSDLPIPFPLKEPDVCKDPDDEVNCPLHKDQEYHYRTTIFVEKKFPSLSVKIKWELVNEKKEKIVCIEFPAKIK